MSGAQLNATATYLGVPVPGTFAYSPSAGTNNLPIGANTLSVTFTPTDIVNYNTATATVTQTVIQPSPVVLWSTPAEITYGTALSATQLNANSVAPGTFVYSPAAGTVLPVGLNILWATFTTTDNVHYNNTPVTVGVGIYVAPAHNIWDVGTVTLNINGSTWSTASYGAWATPSSVAQSLATNLQSGAPVKVNAVDGELNIVATQSNSSTNYPCTITNSGWDQIHFPTGPSFPSGALPCNLTGGADAGTNQGLVYKFTGPDGSSDVQYDGVGNLIGYYDQVMGAWSPVAYDTLNRLVAGTASSGPYTGENLCWGYDAFGNRIMQLEQGTACPPPPTPSQPPSTVYYNTNNQVTFVSQSAPSSISAPTGFGYDQSGDVVFDSNYDYLYDAEGRICAVYGSPLGINSGMATMTGYIYDADGTRVSKGTITAWSCDPSLSGFQTSKVSILGPGSGTEQMTEVDMNAGALTWDHTNVWAAGKLIATYDTAGTFTNGAFTNVALHFYLNDPLGTRRAQTDYAGVLEQACQSLPFGDGLACSGSSQDPTAHHFTGKERDTESGNDDFGARYYASTMGRFMSPDWAAKASPVPYATFDDPQSLNLYSYVRNNPLTRTDPDGHWCWFGKLGDTCDKEPPPLAPPPTPPGLPAGVVTLNYAKNAPRLSSKVERELKKELGKPGVMEATVGYTTNGQHATTSNHYKGLAADIESINGTPMTDKALNTTPDAYKVISDAVQYANDQGAHEVYGPGGQIYKDDKPYTASTPDKQQELIDLHATHLHITVGGGDE